MISVPLFLTEKHPCSYLDGEIAQPAFVHPLFNMNANVYSGLIQQGFRRSGDEVYAPQCPNCSACIPVRIKVADFVPNRSQKRCLRKNVQTQAVVRPAEFDNTHYEMYLRYQISRHQGGLMAKSSAQDYLDFLKSAWCETFFVEFFIEGELAAVATVDEVDHGLSAVYTFYEPKFLAHSLGVYAVLWQIERAKLMGKEFLYLGYWIKECKKMSYKSDYQPLQAFRNKQWKTC